MDLVNEVIIEKFVRFMGDELWYIWRENSGFRGSDPAAIAAVIKVTTNQGRWRGGSLSFVRAHGGC